MTKRSFIYGVLSFRPAVLQNFAGRFFFCNDMFLSLWLYVGCSCAQRIRIMSSFLLGLAPRSLVVFRSIRPCPKYQGSCRI